MIAKLIRQGRYGRNGVDGIYILSELDEKPDEFFAHSTQDALEYLQRLPLYQDAHVVEHTNGSFVVTSQWRPRDKTLDAIFDTNDMQRADYWASQVLIVPVNTIHENTGFKLPANE